MTCLAATRRALRSDAPNVLVEAPAGCGKTYEAAELALEMGAQLRDGSQVLVLAHTNAAVQEFLRRTRNSGGRVRATTIDAFCRELLDPYAARLGLPTPLRRHVGLGSGRIAFADLAPKAVDLLTRCSAVRTMLAYRFPFVILDEHQDTNVHQHQVVASFRDIASCRVRIFGDPMQAIYKSSDADVVSWDDLMRDSSTVTALDTPQRWQEEPDLGEWILRARTELREGRSIPLQSAPRSVSIRQLPATDCVGFGHGNVGALTRPVQEFVRSTTGTIAILSRHNSHVWGLHIAAGGLVRLNEGADYGEAYALLERAAESVGNAQGLALHAIDHLDRVATGLDQAKQKAILNALQGSRIEYGRLQVVKKFLETFEPLYSNPDLRTFCEVAQAIIVQPPEWLTIRMPVCMRLIGQVRPQPGDDPAECLDAVVARIKIAARKHTKAVSTIHKAKGLEFDHVLISNFSSAHFANDELSRRIAYVALSRARRSISILVPGNSPSPLLGGSS
ncbi:UvrD-helicase domain-containing protein [Xanthobacteraceae bacterium Astr-EGSB]|uniref:UvrD-helicase domain-containing protein n=1 Tax=Astrobacterium formosum TaxID=3069710 RepID=UPI0027AE41FE|nr:UvrD-helicase domain-containing protein [Xanthobacteraceae bacterium Astr-EGSB]